MVLNKTSVGAVQSYNVPCESCYGGVHLLEHVIEEFPTSVKSMQQPSDVMKRTVLTCSNVMRSQNNPAKPTSLLERWKGAFGIDSRLGCTQCPGCQVPGSGLMQVFN